MHEILTLQFGQQANYLGTHYWNTQESYFTYAGQEASPVDHDISFRAGIGADGHDTYTPRTLIYDLKGAFGTLRRENALYDVQSGGGRDGDGGGWGGATVPLRLPPVTPSRYQVALEQGGDLPTLTTETIRFWSDYNHLFYHPRSIVQLHEYEVQSQLMPFERWSAGEEFFGSLDREHDLLDRDLRPWLEECDQLQGMQVLTGWDDAWGGFAARYLERIADELGKGCRWVYGLSGAGRGLRERRGKAEAAVRSLVEFQGSASMVVPLHGCPGVLPRYVRVDAGSRWHTSALQAVLVESVSLPMRLRVAEAGRATFDAVEGALCNGGKRTVVSAGLSVDEGGGVDARADARVGNGVTNGCHREDDEDGLEELDIDFFPDFTLSPEPNSTRSRPRPHIFSTTTTLRSNTTSSSSLTASHRTHHSPIPFPTLPSFPQIFRFASQPQKLAIKARLETSTAVAGRLREMEDVVRRVVGVEEREALCEVLGAMKGEYEEGWSEEGEGWDDD
ncbi:tubulin nucleotide-binding domain-like protein [Teratosphaeria nubilosa]|uniref:Tubulin nucleotide-binding domain-like protein n=1 Tax=Teratosphaeria nubilosa TaxID=161662 RepID=A0A6G1L0K2_9PEZI|nr:tubulin nucleotide-binding domain-like protein [Teratosphaeria nubilosa]